MTTPTHEALELLPCPNPECGSGQATASNDWVNFYVYCPACMLKGPRESTENFGVRWNSLARARADVAGGGADSISRQDVITRLEKVIRLWNDDRVTIACADMIAELKAATPPSTEPSEAVRRAAREIIGNVNNYAEDNGELSIAAFGPLSKRIAAALDRSAIVPASTEVGEDAELSACHTRLAQVEAERDALQKHVADLNHDLNAAVKR